MNEEQNNTPAPLAAPAEKKESFFKEVLKFTLIALLVVVPVRLYVAQPFIVNGASMDPTFETGNYLIIDELSYRVEAPKRGDVIVLNPPGENGKFFIKRIIGLPGETVSIHNFTVTIKNAEHPEGFSLHEPYVAEKNKGGRSELSVTLNPTEYFVMGDNRNASFDSRDWGNLERNRIVGRALLRLFPVPDIGAFPGHSPADLPQ